MTRLLSLFLLIPFLTLSGQDVFEESRIDVCKQLETDGNWTELRQAAEEILTDGKSGQDENIAYVWNALVKALVRGNELSDYDDLFHKYVEQKYSGNISLLSRLEFVPEYGYVINHRFKRGGNRGGSGLYASSAERDRIQNLRLMSAAIPEADRQPALLRGEFYRKLAQMILYKREGMRSYLLQIKSDLKVLPEYETGNVPRDSSRPPVNPDGTPVFYKVPKDFFSASNDGERYRYAIQEAVRNGNREAIMDYADFLCSQFDFLSVGGARYEYYDSMKMKEYLYQLKDNETIAELSDGIRKITLPPDACCISLYQKAEAHSKLGEIFLGRMQFERAAEEFRKAGRQEDADQITGIFGKPLEHTVTNSGQKEYALPYQFRNATSASVILYRINTKDAVQKILSNKKDNSSYPYHLFNLPYARREWKHWNTIVGGTPEKTFTVPLKPLPHHWDTMAEIPLSGLKPGAWLVQIVPIGKDGKRGKISETMFWISDSVLSVQNIPNGIRCYLNDPESGKPKPGIRIQIHSFYHVWDLNSKKGISTVHETVSVRTDRNGIAEISKSSFKRPAKSYLEARLFIAETGPEMLTILNSATDCYETMENNGIRKCFFITDCPVYKPGYPVKLTGYFRSSSYGKTSNRYQGKTVMIRIRDPRWNEFAVKEVPFDNISQSFTYEFKLPENALLGRWHIETLDSSAGRASFSVEEYRKPEYLLTVTPEEKSVKAGSVIKAKIQAQYYFGTPLVNAKVTYQIFREEIESCFPFVFPFDWLYGRGYAQCKVNLMENSRHYTRTGRVMIADSQGVTNRDGMLEIAINTSEDVRRYGARDFRYSIEAEVSDSTNRIVKGKGTVIASSQPFDVFMYIPAGFAVTGERISVRIMAQTPDSLPVRGGGSLQIFRRELNSKGIPERSGAALKNIPFKSSGKTELEFILNEGGVYELSAEFVSEEGLSVRKNMTLAVYGNRKGQDLFGEYPLSIAANKPEYRPGETAKILVTTDKPGRTVYFISRSERNRTVQCITLKGYSHLFELNLKEEDQPNTFVEVYSVFDGKLHTLSKQLVLPPETKLLSVKAEPARIKAYPKEKVPLKLTVTDSKGKPVSGSVTVAVYDKALDAVALSAIPEINSFFWSWKRGLVSFLHWNSQWLWSWYEQPEMRISLERSYVNSFYGGGEYVSHGKVFSGMKTKKANAPAAEADAADINQISKNGSQDFIRTDFSDSAFWLGRGTLSAAGTLTIPLSMPDNLTTWRIRVWGLDNDTRVGEGTSEITVSKDMIARIELPRFMVCGDKVSSVVTIHNNTASTMNPDVVLTAPGLLKKNWSAQSAIPSNGTASFHVPLHGTSVGEHILTLTAKSGKERDGIQLKLPVLVKGFDKQINRCGLLDAQKTETEVVLDIPSERRPETTALELNLSPGAAKDMVELLPWLAADDSADVYGTVNRFVPALSVKAALKTLGVKWQDIGFQKTIRDPLYAEYTRFYSRSVPVYSAGAYDNVISKNLEQIGRMVNSDGGWGWFCGRGEISWLDTTAYVTDALLDTQAAGRKVDQRLLQRAVNWLQKKADSRVSEIKTGMSATNADCLLVRVLSKAGKPNVELMKFCYENRVNCLSPYGYAMLALAYEKNTRETKMLIRNLNQFLKTDEENGTAYLNIPSAWRFFWYGNENETLSAYLELLLREDPKSETARKVAKYLVTNIRNSPWRNSTRSLGAAVRALAHYVALSGEGNPDYTVSVELDGKKHEYHFSRKNLWKGNGPALFIPPEKIKTGKMKLKLTLKGHGTLYWNMMLNYFSLENRAAAQGLEMKIRRNYYRLVPKKDARVLLAGIRGRAESEQISRYSRIPLKETDILQPGDMVEVELISTAKNDYDYVVLEDFMPSGFEYVNPESGYQRGFGFIYTEYKERGIRFYLRSMARGESNVFYRIRAQLPGTVTAMPAKGYGLYARELKCNDVSTTLQTK